jgi:hypothetical protein
VIFRHGHPWGRRVLDNVRWRLQGHTPVDRRRRAAVRTEMARIPGLLYVVRPDSG